MPPCACSTNPNTEGPSSPFDHGADLRRLAKAETGRASAQCAVGDKRAHHHDLVIWQRLMSLNDGQSAWNCNTGAGGDIPKFLPPQAGENGVIGGRLEFATKASRHPVNRFPPIGLDSDGLGTLHRQVWR